MEIEQKQRWVGVVVLIALIAVLVPMLFNRLDGLHYAQHLGQRQQKYAAQGAAQAMNRAPNALSARPLEMAAKSKTQLDLPTWQTAQRQSAPELSGPKMASAGQPEGFPVALSSVPSVAGASQQPTPPTAAMQQPLPAQVAANVFTTQPLKSSNAAEPIPARAAEQAASEPTLPGAQPLSQSNTAAEPAVLRVAKPVQAGAAHSKHTLHNRHKAQKLPHIQAQPAHHHPTQPHWTIRLGSFAQYQNAKMLAKRLGQHGYKSRLVKADSPKGPVYRVMVGNFTSPAMLKRTLAKLNRQFHIQGLVDPLPKQKSA